VVPPVVVLVIAVDALGGIGADTGGDKEAVDASVGDSKTLKHAPQSANTCS